MDFIDVVRKRRSIRKYTSEKVSDEKLANIIEAALLAPSGGNRQPWRFIVMKEKDVKAKVADACSKQLWMGDAAVIIVGCCQPVAGIDESALMRDVTIAMENLVLAVVNEGLGACWIGASADRARALRPILQIPPEVGINALVCLGYPAEPPRQKTLKKQEETVCYESYK
jgi:nitroreductase